LKGVDRKLSNKRDHLRSENKALGHKHHELVGKTERLERKDKKLARIGKVLGHKDGALKAEGRKLAKKDASLAKEGRVLAHSNKVAAGKTSVRAAVSSKGKLRAREIEDDMFERDFEELEFDARDFEDDLYLD